MKYILLASLLVAAGCAKEPSASETPSPEQLLESVSPIAHTFTLRPNKKIEMNGVIYDSDEITRLLQESEEKKESVILKVDQNAIASEVVRVVDLIKKDGIEAIYVSTIEE